MSPYSATKAAVITFHQVRRQRSRHRRHLRQCRGAGRRPHAHPRSVDAGASGLHDAAHPHAPYRYHRRDRGGGALPGEPGLLVRHRPVLRRQRRPRNVLAHGICTAFWRVLQRAAIDCHLTMTRRQLLALPAAGALLRAPALSQKSFPGIAYRDYPRCLPDYLRDLARTGVPAAQSRNRAIENALRRSGPASAGLARRSGSWWAANWSARRSRRRRSARSSATVTASRKFCTRAGRGFTSPRIFMFRRPARRPIPRCCFKWDIPTTERRTQQYQRCCQGLARLGYVVLAFDPMGQGERVYYPDQRGHAHAALVIGRRAHGAGQADAAGGRYLLASAGVGRDAQPGLPGVAAHGGSEAHRRRPGNRAAARSPCC